LLIFVLFAIIGIASYTMYGRKSSPQKK